MGHFTCIIAFSPAKRIIEIEELKTLSPECTSAECSGVRAHFMPVSCVHRAHHLQSYATSAKTEWQDFRATQGYRSICSV